MSTRVNKTGKINKIIEKQAVQFEEFGKRLQESHKGYENEFKKLDEKSFETYQKKIESQSKLINSLRTRIEELENDAIKKDQNIKKLRQEIDDSPISYKSSDLLLKTYDKMMERSSWDNTSLNSSNNDTSLNFKVQEIDRLYGDSVKLKQFKFLKSSYNINELIEYTKSNNFIALNRKSKRYINYHIKCMLLQEFQGPNVTLSQDLDEYIKRDILPSLPNGYDNYTMYSDWFDTLNDTYKSRVSKLLESGN
ncbi:hypothetical protein RhiirA5_360689 [Rhizophagus irregularis]|uniref:Uncharacterized protein n=3 Tax=Rhizophagus irregularis TaxID=588596 RepID=U9TT91_RHIID|nr:hypothetical protein GLOIN_2v1499883 [Rhizophagus irregularis DAOM 181602=DAOM 197198]EXX75833.1 hypothetical protein RirG_038460 [Rhizophagus irregularis DAOM 197198w]PKC06010.1 hypothetical protein RhiirA5_360689 [Rhizophagus irregularis]PKC72937.1 hypothetical protein RhiirA1_411169 [Rhizophagus irregularis]POG82210.1 hypothetical protein GLOIN_2v1499883 [Rhizophagus irregularis DAOM 181602=DAOM 197198]UZO23029.1 hypothetical protein OCT59_015375 [Rhizophagus irregularis]|eukprot:XP_025189076.1 hypothetical protein GLOIN_2v1499883 [Rhizophagus irregularis DAOM 181602=DAOM 197198]